MEPASLALGILPVLAGAIKAYKAARRKYKVFKHASREVSRLRTDIQFEEQFFENECHLLLRLALTDDHHGVRKIREMMDDQDSKGWKDHDLDSRLSTRLANSLSVCQGILTETSNTIEELKSQLSCYEELLLDRQEDESIREVFRRTRKSTSAAWNKSKADACIKSLQNDTLRLQQLRQQLSELREPVCDVATILRSGKRREKPIRECTELRNIRKASQALHGAFSAAWSKTCREGKLEHSVRLFLDAKVEEDVRMDVAVECHHGHDTANLNPLSQDMAWLVVRSQTLDWVDAGASQKEKMEEGRCDQPPRKTRKVVRFAAECHTKTACPPVVFSGQKIRGVPFNFTTRDGPLRDLLMFSNICSIITKRADQPSRSHSGLGYIETRCGNLYRHSFFSGSARCEPRATFHLNNTYLDSVASLEDTLNCDAEHKLDYMDQLKLARNLVLAVLKFHRTPWLNDFFCLRDLSLFITGEQVSEALETLHVGYLFSQQLMNANDFQSPPYDIDMGGTDTNIEITSKTPTKSSLSRTPDLHTLLQQAKPHHNIRNPTLWSLGSILLQIGNWAKLTTTTPDQVSEVRRLSSTPCMMGPKYQSLAKKCLDCDFGYGDDLSRPKLQDAVYEKLVCELNEMIRCLDLDSEEDEIQSS